MFRFVNPSRDIRVAGGREVNLRHLQALALWPANSIFVQRVPDDGGRRVRGGRADDRRCRIPCGRAGSGREQGGSRRGPLANG